MNMNSFLDHFKTVYIDNWYYTAIKVAPTGATLVLVNLEGTLHKQIESIHGSEFAQFLRTYF